MPIKNAHAKLKLDDDDEEEADDDGQDSIDNY